MNARDIFDVYVNRKEEERRVRRERETQVFFNKCLRAIDGEMAYKHFCDVVDRTLGMDSYHSSSFILVNYFFENDLYLEMSITDWLSRDDGPLMKSRYKAEKMFPEFAIISKDPEDIIEMANKVYGLDLEWDDDFDADFFFSYSFDWNSFEPIDLDEVRNVVAKQIEEMME